MRCKRSGSTLSKPGCIGLANMIFFLYVLHVKRPAPVTNAILSFNESRVIHSFFLKKNTQPQPGSYYICYLDHMAHMIHEHKYKSRRINSITVCPSILASDEQLRSNNLQIRDAPLMNQLSGHFTRCVLLYYIRSKK
jgi:hypothetical protein